jgi:hypothetical protein
MTGSKSEESHESGDRANECPCRRKKYQQSAQGPSQRRETIDPQPATEYFNRGLLEQWERQSRAKTIKSRSHDLPRAAENSGAMVLVHIEQQIVTSQVGEKCHVGDSGDGT